MGFVTDRTSASLNRYTKSVAANYVLPKNVEGGRFPVNITNDFCGYVSLQLQYLFFPLMSALAIL